MIGISYPLFSPSPTRFVGREKELTNISLLLDNPDCRLLTLVGPGGIGKTRLAMEVAQRKVNTFTHGVFGVDLALLESADGLVPAMAAALHFQFIQASESQTQSMQRQRSDMDSRTQLLDYLREKHLLIVLDNFERLLAGVNLVDAILTTAPRVHLLITSREVLNLKWEYLYDVQGLTIPTPGESPDPETHSAIQLFVDRAVRYQRHFSLLDDPVSVTRICSLIEGMPLGIELAASWLRVLPCGDLAAELERNLGFLTSRQRTSDERHYSLNIVFEQSWRLLNCQEQEGLMKLSVFCGSFPRNAAEIVARVSLEILSTLIDKSMLRITADGRYNLHTLVRHFVAEKLTAYPLSRTEVFERHSGYYSAFLAAKKDNLKSGGISQATDEIEAAISDVRAAWKYAIHNGNNLVIEEAEESLYYFLLMQANYAEGIEVFGEAIAAWATIPAGDNCDRVLGKLLARRGGFWRALYHKENALESLRQSLELLRASGDQAALAFCLEQFSYAIFMDAQQHKALLLAEESLTLYQATDDLFGVATVLRYIGWYQLSLLEVTAAKNAFEQSLMVAKVNGSHYQIAWCLFALAKIAQESGYNDEAKQQLQHCVIVAQEGNIPEVTCKSLDNLQGIALGEGNWVEARQYCEAQLELAQHLGGQQRLFQTATALGWLNLRLGDFDRAKVQFEKILAAAPNIHDPDILSNTFNGLAGVAIGIKDYEGANRYLHNALEIAKEVDDRMKMSAALCTLGFVAFLRRAYADAKRYCQESLAIYSQQDTGPDIRVATLINLGHATAASGEAAASRHSYREGLTLAWKHNLAPFALEAIAGMARHEATSGRLEYAVELLALAKHDVRSNPDVRIIVNPLLDELRSELPEDMFAAAVARGKTLEMEIVVEELLAADEAEVSEGIGRDQARSSLNDLLSARELEILRLVAQGHSNRQIAAELCLALGTVKTHLHNLCGKLDAQNRTQAVARARELDLLLPRK